MPKRMVSLLALLIILPFAPPSQTENPAPVWTEFQYAPYISPSYNLALLNRTIGVRYFTLAFVISGGECDGLWHGSAQLDQYFLVQDLQNLREQGGDVIVSFGGAAGDELGQVCEDVESLTDAYQRVVDALDVTRLDFDIEGDEARHPESLERRSQAIAALHAANPDLHVSYTLAVLPSGLLPDGLRILESAIEHGARIDLVNLMTMDYGPDFAPDEMGEHAINAAENTHDQLAELFPEKSDAELWAMIGLTPMIGLNDVIPEEFTLEDAAMVTEFAIERGIGRLAMWSVDRDRECVSGARVVVWNCSGISQDEYAFSQIFNALTR